MAKAAKDAEAGSAMDYAEHDRTFANFILMSKWLIAVVVALLLAMAAGFFGGMGLVGGTLVFIVLSIVAYFLV